MPPLHVYMEVVLDYNPKKIQCAKNPHEFHMASMDDVGQDSKALFGTNPQGMHDGICSRKLGLH